MARKKSKLSNFNFLRAAVAATGISKAQLIVKAIKYCIKNNINLNDD